MSIVAAGHYDVFTLAHGVWVKENEVNPIVSSTRSAVVDMYHGSQGQVHNGTVKVRRSKP